MELFGIRPTELLVIVLVAVLVMGPARMIEMARSLGRFWGEAQRTLKEVADSATRGLDSAPLEPLSGPTPAPVESVGRDGAVQPQAEEEKPPENGHPAQGVEEPRRRE